AGGERGGRGGGRDDGVGLRGGRRRFLVRGVLGVGVGDTAGLLGEQRAACLGGVLAPALAVPPAQLRQPERVGIPAGGSCAVVHRALSGLRDGRSGDVRRRAWRAGPIVAGDSSVAHSPIGGRQLSRGSGPSCPLTGRLYLVYGRPYDQAEALGRSGCAAEARRPLLETAASALLRKGNE